MTVPARTAPPTYGLLAEFDNPDRLLDAVAAARQAGYRKMDAYTPFPVHGLEDAMELPRTWVPLIVLLGGIIGLVTGYLLQYWISAIAYPLNIGGRPLVSWPAWVPVMFEMTILVSSLAAVVGMFALNGLPQPYHPVFNVPGFERASRDRFFLCIEATDPRFDRQATRAFLQNQGALEVSDVPH